MATLSPLSVSSTLPVEPLNLGAYFRFRYEYIGARASLLELILPLACFLEAIRLISIRRYYTNYSLGSTSAQINCIYLIAKFIDCVSINVLIVLSFASKYLLLTYKTYFARNKIVPGTATTFFTTSVMKKWWYKVYHSIEIKTLGYQTKARPTPSLSFC